MPSGITARFAPWRGRTVAAPGDVFHVDADGMLVPGRPPGGVCGNPALRSPWGTLARLLRRGSRLTPCGGNRRPCPARP